MTDQFDAELLKAWILKRLDEVREAVESEGLDAVERLCFWSPAGDGMGADNNVIEFGLPGLTADPEYVDIVQAMTQLNALRRNA